MITEEQKELFYKGIEETGNVSTASKLAGFDRSSGYRIKNDDPEAFKEAYKGFLDNLEEMFIKSVRDGVWEDVVFEGKVTGERKYKQSPPLIAKLMESKHPDYKQRQAIEHSGKIDLESKTDEELQTELNRLRGLANE